MCRWLDQHRLITTEVYVVPAQYVRIFDLEVTIVPTPGWSASDVRATVSARLETYFSYTVDQLGLQQLFDARAAGIAQIVISGKATVLVTESGTVKVTSEVQVTTQSTVGTSTGATNGCFDELIPFGLMADPAHGAQDMKLLLLAAIYSYFTDVTQKSGGAWTAQRLAASRLYAAAWLLLGVNVNAQNATDAQKQELARILANLFQCWCDAMLYPGPRCESEHHGVYLGCATVNRTGQILTFDMWEGRRQVLTGPLLEHWLGVFGIAAPDVIAARLAQAICCAAGLPLPTLPPGRGTAGGGDNGGTILLGRGAVSVRTATTPATAGPASAVELPELIARMVGALVADDAAPLARFTTQLASGAVVEVSAPSATAPSAGRDASLLAAPIAAVLARADPKLSPLAGVAARVAITEVAHDIAPAALPNLTGPAAALAKQLGLSLAGLVAAGPEGLLSAATTADPATVDELAMRAADAFTGLGEGVVTAIRKAKVGKPSVVLKDAAVRKAVAADLGKKFAGLTPGAVDAALDRGAANAP